MTNKDKLFAETLSIFKEPTQINDYLFSITEKYACEMRKTWNDFIINELYERYKRLGFTKVLLISKEDYEKFLNWALPKYKEEVLGDE